MRTDDRVWFKLTPRGLEMLEWGASRAEALAPGSKADLMKNTDGWYSMPLYEVMEIFGPRINEGQFSPFKNCELKTECPYSRLRDDPLAWEMNMPEQETIEQLRAERLEFLKAEAIMLLEIAQLSRITGDYEDAKREFQEVLDLDPENLEAKKALEELTTRGY